jgi:tRNA U54 and U55 pseudouridine synthase Pus10
MVLNNQEVIDMLEEKVKEMEQKINEVFTLPYHEAIKRNYNSETYKAMISNMSGTGSKGRPGIIFSAAWK